MTDLRLARPSWRGRTNVDALTIACIEHAEALGGHEFVVTQGSYQAGAGDVNSAGTHDRGGVVDLRWCGHRDCIRALRLAGMAAWHRTPEQGPWVDHVHAVVIGHPMLADSAHRQVIAYLDGRNGLKNDGADDGPQLTPIPRPIWPYPQENDMALTDEDVQKILNTPTGGDGLTVRQALRRGSKVAGLEDAIAARVSELLLNEPHELPPFDAEQIEAAVKQALREGVGE